jgi:hypothetical protein
LHRIQNSFDLKRNYFIFSFKTVTE